MLHRMKCMKLGVSMWPSVSSRPQAMASIFCALVKRSLHCGPRSNPFGPCIAQRASLHGHEDASLGANVRFVPRVIGRLDDWQPVLEPVSWDMPRPSAVFPAGWEAVSRRKMFFFEKKNQKLLSVAANIRVPG
jgi:hypothetical protein